MAGDAARCVVARVSVDFALWNSPSAARNAASAKLPTPENCEVWANSGPAIAAPMVVPPYIATFDREDTVPRAFPALPCKVAIMTGNTNPPHAMMMASSATPTGKLVVMTMHA